MSETIQELCSSLGVRLTHSGRRASRTFRDYALHWTRPQGPTLDTIQVHQKHTVEEQIDAALDLFGWMLPVPRFGSQCDMVFGSESLDDLADSLTHAIVLSRLPLTHDSKIVVDASDSSVMLMSYSGLVESAPFVPFARSVVSRADDVAVALSMWLLKPDIVAQIGVESFYDPGVITDGRHTCEVQVQALGVSCKDLLWTCMLAAHKRMLGEAVARLPATLPGFVHWASHCAMFGVPDTTLAHVSAEVHHWHRELGLSEDFLRERAYIQNAVLETPEVYFNVTL